MKILQITPYYLPHTGGVERYVANLSKYLAKNGHEIEIYTSNIPPVKNSENISGITIQRYKSIAEPLRNPIIPGLIIPKKERIKQFDLIQIHLLYSSVALFGYIIKKIENKPLILTHHGQVKFGNNYWDSIVKIYEKIVFPPLLKNADYSIVLSDSDAKHINSLGMDKNRIAIIPNAICVDDFFDNNSDNVPDINLKYQLSDIFTVLFVGELSARKGIIFLIKAFLILNSRGLSGKVKLLIVGTGNQYEILNKFVKNNKIEDMVLFLGNISFAELLGVYKSSKIFVLPSLSEGLPTVILEAMFFEIPVIATDIPGIRDHFNNTALLIPPKDEIAIADAIITLINDRELANKLKLNGKKLVLSEYTWDKISLEYDKIFSNLIHVKNH